jgi:hypothetical protein
LLANCPARCRRRLRGDAAVRPDGRSALDEADPDPRHIADLLDGIPGAFERAQLGLEQARAGLGVPLDEL